MSVVSTNPYVDHPPYAKALRMFRDTQIAQIKKGLEKYPEPLNPDSWTHQELLQHFFEEMVDLAHYASALFIKCEQMEKELERLKQTKEE